MSGAVVGAACFPHAVNSRHHQAEVVKGAWRMPWLTEAMKDVISCDKRGLGANIL